MRHETALVWVCACNDPDIEYGQCTPAKPFRSLKRKETAEHERNHIAHIEWYNRQMEMVVNIESVIESELRIGTWDDWKDLLNATKAFAKFAHEHQGVYGRSFFLRGASDDLERAMRNLIWYQTIEGKVVDDHRRMGAVYKTLDVLFGDIKRRGERKRFPRLPLETRFAAAGALLDEIERETKKIDIKFPHLEGLREVVERFRICYQQIDGDLRKSHKEAPGRG